MPSNDSAMTKLTREQFIPFIGVGVEPAPPGPTNRVQAYKSQAQKLAELISNINKLTKLAAEGDIIWAQVDYSTQFELTMNEEEEDMDYICFKNPVTEIKSNKPELPQEIATYEGNACYDFMIAHFYDMPIGSACKVPFLMCFGGTAKLAWLCTATLTSKVLNTVDGKITFSIKLGGDIQKGTYTIEDGKPTFVPPNADVVEVADKTTNGNVDGKPKK